MKSTANASSRRIERGAYGRSLPTTHIAKNCEPPP